MLNFVGLPASPPIEPSSGVSPTAGQNPFGVEVKKKSYNLAIGTIAIIALCSAASLVICLGAFWIGMLKFCHHAETKTHQVEPGLFSTWAKRSGKKMR